MRGITNDTPLYRVNDSFPMHARACMAKHPKPLPPGMRSAAKCDCAHVDKDAGRVFPFVRWGNTQNEIILATELASRPAHGDMIPVLTRVFWLSDVQRVATPNETTRAKTAALDRHYRGGGDA